MKNIGFFILVLSVIILGAVYLSGTNYDNPNYDDAISVGNDILGENGIIGSKVKTWSLVATSIHNFMAWVLDSFKSMVEGISSAVNWIRNGIQELINGIRKIIDWLPWT